MNKRMLAHLAKVATLVAMVIPMLPAYAESLAQYVDACKSELGFDTIPKFSCANVQFRQANSGTYLGLSFSESDDFVAHRRINDSVDAVFACRWVARNGNTDRAVGGEMILHNRKKGATCFFELNDTFENSAYPQVPLSPVPPTDSKAANTWHIGGSCTSCHAAGPYIASPQIASALARFGLINDGHDTFNTIYYAVHGTVKQASQPSCSTKCHVLGGSPPVNSVIGAGLVFGSVVMPSINHVIDDIANKGLMPPNPKAYSDYRWVNRDYPGGNYDSETLTDINNEYPDLACSNPIRTEAHVVDSSAIFYSDAFYDKIRTFNLKEGFVCKDVDQPNGGHCADYATRYLCGGTWTGWYSHARSSSGDDESRDRFPNLCASPTDIQVRVPMYSNGSLVAYVNRNGPPDPLYQFDSKGLTCKNADQPDGVRCHNYVVRFICN